MNKIKIKLNYRYFIIFLISLIVIIVSMENNYGFFRKFFECIFDRDNLLNFLFKHGEIPSLDENYGLFDLYIIHCKTYYYGYESMIIWSTQLFQILLPVIAGISSFWIFRDLKNIDSFVVNRKGSYSRFIFKKILLNSVKVAIAFFASYFLLLVFVEIVHTSKNSVQSARYILTDIFSENLYFNHMFLYFILEGLIRFFMMPFVYSFFASSLALHVNRAWVAYLIPNIYYFLLTLLGYVMLSKPGILREMAIYVTPSLIMGSGDYYGFSTILLILVNCIPLFIGILITIFKVRAYERL